MKFFEVVACGKRARFTPCGEGGSILVSVGGTERLVTAVTGGFHKVMDNARTLLSSPLSSVCLSSTEDILNELDYVQNDLERGYLDVYKEAAPGRGVTLRMQ